MKRLCNSILLEYGINGRSFRNWLFGLSLDIISIILLFLQNYKFLINIPIISWYLRKSISFLQAKETLLPKSHSQTTCAVCLEKYNQLWGFCPNSLFAQNESDAFH